MMHYVCIVVRGADGVNYLKLVIAMSNNTQLSREQFRSLSIKFFHKMVESTQANGGASGAITPDGRFLDPVTTSIGYMVSLSPTADYTKVPLWIHGGEVIGITPKGATLTYPARADKLRKASVLGELRTADSDVLMWGFVERMELINQMLQEGSGKGLYVGMWETNGLTCLDISLHAYSESLARVIGKAGNQQAIFDIANLSDINL